MAMRRLATPVTGTRALMANAREVETTDTRKMVRRKMKKLSAATWNPAQVHIVPMVTTIHILGMEKEAEIKYQVQGKMVTY